MTTILHLDASARTTRSLSRRLSQRFVNAWLARRPRDRVIRRDLAADPPPHVTEAWIAACFAPPAQRDASMRATLAWSDTAISELEAAELIVMGTPMYNYGMPSALKAWFDQVIRIGRTFSFDLGRGNWPLEPIMAGKRLVVLSARGEFGFAPGGVRARRNQLDPHIATCAPLIGVTEDAIHAIAIEHQEFGDERHARSLAEARSKPAPSRPNSPDPRHWPPDWSSLLPPPWHRPRADQGASRTSKRNSWVSSSRSSGRP